MFAKVNSLVIPQCGAVPSPVKDIRVADCSSSCSSLRPVGIKELPEVS